VKAKTEPFMLFYREAEHSNDPIRQYFLYDIAAKNIPKDALNMIFFAIALHPEKAVEFNDARAAVLRCQFNINKAKSSIALFVKCSDDIDNLIYNSVAKSFSDNGMKVVSIEGLSSNWCEITVSENKQVLRAGTFLTPSANITVYGSGGALFSWNGGIGERIGATNPDIAKRRAFSALAEEITKTMWNKFENNMRNKRSVH
jgi:hypothetical protein